MSTPYPDIAMIRLGALAITGSSKGYAWFPGEPTWNNYWALSGDIYLDTDVSWAAPGVAGTGGSPDILAMATHEIGHALGLEHYNISDPIEGISVMNSSPPRRQGLGTGSLTSDDIAGIQSIYGTGVGSVTPIPVPEPSSFALLGLSGLALFLRRRR